MTPLRVILLEPSSSLVAFRAFHAPAYVNSNCGTGALPSTGYKSMRWCWSRPQLEWSRSAWQGLSCASVLIRQHDRQHTIDDRLSI